MAATPLPLSRAEDLHGLPKTPSTVTPFVLEPVICVPSLPPWCPERMGNRATPTERTSLSVSLSKGFSCCGWEPGEGRSYAFSFLFSSQSFQFHHLHKLVSIRGLVDSKQGHYPESVHRVRRTARVSRLTVPGQCSPSFGSSMDSHCFLWWLVGFFGFLFSSFTHIANCPKGNTPEAPSSQGP